MHPLIEKFNPDRLTIKEFDNWLITVRTKQVTLGCTVIILKRVVGSLADLLPSEAEEFIEAARWFERSASDLFSAEKFNYIAARLHFMMPSPTTRLPSES